MFSSAKNMNNPIISTFKLNNKDNNMGSVPKQNVTKQLTVKTEVCYLHKVSYGKPENLVT